MKNQFAIHTDSITVRTQTGVDIRNITDELKRFVKKRKIDVGLLHVFVTGSTGSVTTIEYEPGVVEDLRRAVNEAAPPDREYEHEKAWHDGNGHSHVQAALLGPGLGIPIRDGRLSLGTWQQVVVINHDSRPRDRIVELTLIGSTEDEA